MNGRSTFGVRYRDARDRTRVARTRARLAALLGGAFADDPMLVWPFGEERTELVTDFFGAFDTETATRGWLWEAGDAVGVAAWIPPGSDGGMMGIDRALRPMMDAAGARHAEFWDWIAERSPDEPFW